jgi:drug/metabolite transporter (DMT)-like permease
MNKKALAYVMLTVSSVIFGFSFLFTKETLAHLDIFQLLGLRFLLAAAIMAVLALTGVIKLNLSAYKIKAMLPLVLLQPSVYFIGETYGIKLTSSSESGMMIALMPIAIALFSIRILKERLILRQWLAVAASVAGVALIVGEGGFTASGNISGYLLLIMAVVAEGLYSPLAKRMTQKCAPVEMTFIMICAGAVVFNAIGLTEAAAVGTLGTYFTDALQPGVITGLLYLSALSSVAAFFFYNYALSKVKASSSASFCNLTTVVSVFAGVIFGGEELKLIQAAGMALILISIWGIVSERAPRISEEIADISIKS